VSADRLWVGSIGRAHRRRNLEWKSGQSLRSSTSAQFMCFNQIIGGRPLADGRLTKAQVAALAELEASDLFTAIAWRIKEKLRWVRRAQSVQAARWGLTNFLRHANDLLDPNPLLDPVRKANGTVEAHSRRILQRWTSSHSNGST
jgi:hypothetical protein